MPPRAVPPWTIPAPDPVPLPATADVVIIGGGIAALAAASFLTRGGARPVILAPSLELRHPGNVFLGLAEFPWRLLASLGPDRAREFFRFSRENLELAADLLPVRRGGIWAAIDAREAEDLARSADALQACGIAVDRWSAGQVAEALGTPAFGPGLFLPDEAQVDPAAAIDALRSAAVAIATRVTHVGSDTRGVVVRTDAGEIVADMVVFAGGAELRDVEPYFEDKLFPYREQALATVPVGPRFHHAGRTQLGYSQWRQDADGRVIVAGCRWATPHLEEGETDPVPVDAVQQKLDQLVSQRFPDLAGAEVTHRWAWIDTKSCDNLPLIGPMPGSVRMVVCAGFSGNDLGLGIRAARGVADGILTGTAPGVPSFMTPARLV